jgi:hypothetical protein
VAERVVALGVVALLQFPLLVVFLPASALVPVDVAVAAGVDVAAGGAAHRRAAGPVR